MHRAFSSGHAVAEKASAALIAQQRTVGELDALQDDAVEAWASARTGAGAKRLQPFADLKGPSASDIKGMGDRAEAELIVKLAAKDKKHPDAKVKKKAAAADAAARAVLKASDPI